MKKTVGIIFADEMEYRPFELFSEKYNAKKTKALSMNTLSFTLPNGENQLEVIAVECGIGKVNASLAAAQLILCNNADYILNAGLSGAISGVCRGDIVVGESYVECDFDLRPIGYKLAEKPGEVESVHSADEKLLSLAKTLPNIHVGKLGTGDLFLTDKEKKQSYKEMFKLTAFDMETGAIAAVCKKCDTPFLSIRKISDDADDASPESYREMNDRQENHLSLVLEQLLNLLVNAL